MSTWQPETRRGGVHLLSRVRSPHGGSPGKALPLAAASGSSVTISLLFTNCLLILVVKMPPLASLLMHTREKVARIAPEVGFQEH